MSVGESDRAEVPVTQGKSQVGDPGEGKARRSRGPLGGPMGGAQKPIPMSPELQRIAEKARGDRKLQFTSLAHLLYGGGARGGVEGAEEAEQRRD
jgi:hypothetical protein